MSELRWIRYEQESLPKDLDLCWLYMPALKIGQGIVVGYWCADRECFVDTENITWPDDEISHYMVIDKPKPPKE